MSEPDDGIFDGMNKGISLTTGDVVEILNADDQYRDPLVLPIGAARRLHRSDGVVRSMEGAR